jgi:hypothetical protein
VTRYFGRHGTKRVAAAVRVGILLSQHGGEAASLQPLREMSKP